MAESISSGGTRILAGPGSRGPDMLWSDPVGEGRQTVSATDFRLTLWVDGPAKAPLEKPDPPRFVVRTGLNRQQFRALSASSRQVVQGSPTDIGGHVADTAREEWTTPHLSWQLSPGNPTHSRWRIGRACLPGRLLAVVDVRIQGIPRQCPGYRRASGNQGPPDAEASPTGALEDSPLALIASRT